MFQTDSINCLSKNNKVNTNQYGINDTNVMVLDF